MLYVILISGTYTESINGKDETAQRTAIAAICSDRAKADAIVASGPRLGPNWGTCAMWVEAATVDAEPLFL